MKFASRLDAVPPYLFAELERKIEERERAGIDVISLGIGIPDLPTPPVVIEAMAEAVRDSATHQYPSNRGTASFREAVAGFYAERFGVTIDPETEVIPVLGGKEGVAHVALATLDPGDTALAPDPGYRPTRPARSFPEPTSLPAAGRGERVPARPRQRPRGQSPVPQLPEQPDRSDGRGRLLRARRRVRAPARPDRRARQRLLGDHVRRIPGADFLEAEGAKDVGVEIFSLSKGWNMTGWRAAWIAGNAEVVERYRHLKTNLDSGMFDAVQRAAIAALTEARGFPREMSQIYQRRRDRGRRIAGDRAERRAAASDPVFLGPRARGPRRPRLPSSSSTAPTSSSPPVAPTARAARASSASRSLSPTIASKRRLTVSHRRWP